jgi:hypothetical protein
MPRANADEPLRRRLGWGRVIVDVGFLGVVALFVLPTVVVAVGQRGVVMGMRVPRGAVLIIVTETPGVMVADMPVVVTVLSCGVGMLRFLPLAFGSLPDIGHCGLSFRKNGCLNNPA